MITSTLQNAKYWSRFYRMSGDVHNDKFYSVIKKANGNTIGDWGDDEECPKETLLPNPSNNIKKILKN